MRTGLIRWTPQNAPVGNRVNRLFDEAFNNFLATTSEPVVDRGWIPAVDIRETDDHLVFTAELPGMTKEDIEITLEKGVLTLRGERNFEKDTEQENYHRIERQYGSFTRAFSLHSNVDTEKVDANFENGLLQVKLPKVDEAKPHRIAIR